MTDDSRALLLIGGGIALSIMGACYVVSNVHVCKERWQWTGSEYKPSSTWVSMDCVMHDSNGNCTVTVPITHVEPEKFIWIFNDCIGEAHKKFVTGLQFMASPQHGYSESFEATRWKKCPCEPLRGW